LSTIHVTLVLLVPTTVATKALKTLPAETVAVAGETVTLIGPLAPGLPLPSPPQPLRKVEIKGSRRRKKTTGALNCFTNGYLIPLHADEETRSKRVEFELSAHLPGDNPDCLILLMGAAQWQVAS
jgi:hypothetical protein